jgi:hypothetical protein
MTLKDQLSLFSISALITAIPLLQGCPSEVDEPPALGEIGTQYLDYLELFNEADQFYCECQTQAGDFESVQECVAYFGGPVVPPILAECVAQTLDEIEQARDHLECLISWKSTVLECMETTGCGGDLAACEQLAPENCPVAPYEVEAAMAEDCLGYSLPPAFECADGTKIQSWLECNFSSDCPDGSDELNCP